MPFSLHVTVLLVTFFLPELNIYIYIIQISKIAEFKVFKNFLTLAEAPFLGSRELIYGEAIFWLEMLKSVSQLKYFLYLCNVI